MALLNYNQRVAEVMEDLRTLDPQEFWLKYDGDPILFVGMDESEYNKIYTEWTPQEEEQA